MVIEPFALGPSAADPGDPRGGLSLFSQPQRPWRDSPLFSRTLDRLEGRVEAAIESFPDVPVPRDAGGGYTHEQHKSNGIAIHDAGVLYLWTGDLRYARHAKELLLAYADLYPTLGEHPERKNQAPGRLF